MSESSQHITAVLQYFNESVTYALLRNYEALPFDTESRDIDIVISRREYRTHKSEIVKTLTQGGWRIFLHQDNGRLISFVMAKTKEGEIDMVQWDFFTDTSVHGVELLSAEEMLASRKFNGVLYHVSKEYEFLDKYLYNRAVGADYPAKYSDLKSEVSQSGVVKSKLQRTFGCSGVAEVDKMSGLLLVAFRRNMLFSPLSTLIKVAHSLWLYLLSYLKSSVAPVIAFTGADGAGKTTLVKRIVQGLSPLYKNATYTFHFRPNLIANISETLHDLGAHNIVNKDYSKPHRAGRSSTLSSLLRLCYYSMDYVFGYLVKVKPYSRANNVIIFDRYYSDMIVDSGRSVINLNMKFLYGWGRLFIPRARYNFLITADVNTILSRKQELTREEIEVVNSNMEYLALKPIYYLIYNDSTAQEAVEEIFETVLAEQHIRNLKRI